MEGLSREALEGSFTRTVAIFGAGKSGRFIAEMLGDMGCEVDFFLDNDIRKQGKQIGMARIISPEQFAKTKDDFWIFLSFKNPEVERQLLNLGISSKNILDLSACARGQVISFFHELCKESSGKKEYRFLLEEDRKTLCKAVSKIEFYDGILFISGWVIPSDRIHKVTIMVNGTREVPALREERRDVAKTYPYHNTDTCGYFYIGGTEFKEDITVEVLFWEGDAIIGNLVRRCKYETACKLIEHSVQEGKQGELTRTILMRKDYLLHAKESVAEVLRGYGKKFIDLKDKLYIYGLLYRLDMFDNRDMKDYLEIIGALDDIEAQAWLCEQEIPWMIFLHPEFKVKEIYGWQRSMYHDIARKIYAGKEAQKKVDERRIVILVDNLASDVYASAIFEIAIANELEKRGYQVLMVVLDTSFSPELDIHPCIMHQRSSMQYEKQHKKMKNTDWAIYYCQRVKFWERKIEAYDVIEEYRPCFVIDISQAGLIVSAALFQHQFKIVHIPLSGYSCGAVFNRYITKSKKLSQIDNEIYHSMDEEQIFEAPIKIPYKLDISHTYERHNYGICEDDFVLVTVGNRLQYELDTVFLLHMRKLLLNNKKMKWIIVGRNLGAAFYEHMDVAIETEQVIEWGFEEHMSSLYRICDVYVNPNRLGGGGSVELAMEHGIPIAMTQMISDVTPVIKSENCKLNYDEMFFYIKKLFESEEVRAVEGQKMKQLIHRKELTIEHYVDVVIEAYQDCRKENCEWRGNLSMEKLKLKYIADEEE